MSPSRPERTDLSTLHFRASPALSLGVELELQLVSLRDYDLTRAATDLLAGLRYDGRFGEIKLEITESMIEVSTLPRLTAAGIRADLRGLRDVLLSHCRLNNIAICGGGTHPFHRWPERRICPGERFAQLNERYGYLSKQFTVFGQHIHIGVPSGDDAIWLTHALNVHVPFFVALSASSPFVDATDTGFESARLNAVSAFPLSGQAPDVADWAAFLDHMGLLQACGVADSIKDLYWDVRPKPEYGTVEVRVCDTPLSVERASDLAAFAQCLVRYLLRERLPQAPQLQALVARYNKFQACRFGFAAELADPAARRITRLADALPELLDRLADDAADLDCTRELARLRELARSAHGDAAWLRETAATAGSLNDLTRAAAECFAAAPGEGGI
jgi:carboxylate-amine ligase